MRDEGLLAAGVDKREAELKAIVFSRFHTLDLHRGVAVTRYFIRSAMLSPALFAVVEAPPFGLRKQEPASFQRLLRPSEVAVSSVEGRREFFDAESFAHPCAIASPEPGEATSIASLKAKVSEEIRRLDTRRRMRRGVHVQAISDVVLTPLEPCNHDFKVAGVYLPDDLRFERAVRVSAVHSPL